MVRIRRFLSRWVRTRLGCLSRILPELIPTRLTLPRGHRPPIQRSSLLFPLRSLPPAYHQNTAPPPPPPPLLLLLSIRQDPRLTDRPHPLYLCSQLPYHRYLPLGPLVSPTRGSRAHRGPHSAFRSASITGMRIWGSVISICGRTDRAPRINYLRCA